MNFKTFSILSYFIFYPFIINAQFDPPEINFLGGLEENWRYVSYDSNFVKYPYDLSPASPYWGNIPVYILQKDDNILILELCSAQSPYNGQTGSLIHKLNYKTGELEWIDHNNMYTGLDYYEDYLGGYLKANDDNKIELAGLRSYYKIDKNDPGFVFYGSPVQRLIDYNTGQLLEINIGSEKTEERAGASGIGFMTAKNSKGQMFRIVDKVTFPDGIIHENLDFHLIDDDLNIIYPPYDSIIHNSELHSTEYSLSYPVGICYVADDTIMVTFGKENPEDANYSPTDLTLNWIYIGDKDSIHIIKSVNIVDDLYFPQGGEYIRKLIMHEGVVLSQRVISNDPDVPTNRFIWLAWYDHHGNKMAKIDYLTNEDHYYFDLVQPLFNKDGSLYIAARRKAESNDTTYHDILKINQGENNFEKVGCISSKHEDNLDIYISKSILLPGDQFFTYFWINEKLGDITTNFVYYYNFDIEDIGITTSNNDMESDDAKLSIYPNPASNKITFTYENSQAKYLEVIDQLGRILLRDNNLKQNQQTLDISGLNDGLYYARVTNRNGKILKIGKFVKK